MDFSSPSEADVDMIHDDTLLDINLAAQYHPGNQGLMGSSLSDAFGIIPGVAPLPNHSNHMHVQQQGFNSVEEYAALIGVKLENQDDMQPSTPMTHMQPNMNHFDVQPTPDPAKIQANTAYFDSLYRERGGGGGGGGMMSTSDVTSMTLPAGVGSGINFVNAQGAPQHHAPSVYDRSTELAFNHMNQRMYDPTSGYTMHKPSPHRMVQHPIQDLSAQTLSPELLTAMMKNNNYDNMSEEEKAAFLKEEKSRERNRDHSRKSRLRKKEFVESLKQEVMQLQIYQQICEHSQDLIAMISDDAKLHFIYTSASYGRVLGFQPHQLVPKQTTFLDLVHPDHVADVRAVLQTLENLGDSHRFRFRIKTADGEVCNAETIARKAEKCIVCSTRVDRGT